MSYIIPPTPYPYLNEVLEELVRSVQAILGDNFLAACLQGSFAVGDFDPDSDCDFIVVTHYELTHNQVQALQAMQERIYKLDNHWAKHLEGSYIQKDIFRHYTGRGKPVWYFDHGATAPILSTHDNTIVVRWTVREFGVPLAGPHPSTLVDPIPASALREEIMETMHKWGRQIIANPQEINNRFYQCFSVLHYCRMLHDLYSGYPGSKRAGAEWAKVELDPSWRDLIDRAWLGRPDPATSVRQQADPADLQKTVEFVQYALKISKQIADEFELINLDQ